jgi:hypothetical protein
MNDNGRRHPADNAGRSAAPQTAPNDPKLPLILRPGSDGAPR